MKIAFSARGLSVSSGGARQFIQSLIPALAECRGDDELIVLYNRRQFLGLAPDCTEIAIGGRNRIWWDFVRLPQTLRRLKVDAAIFPKNVIPFFTGCDNYVVVHDLGYFVPNLDAYRWLDTTYMRLLVPRSMRRAKRVFAVSNHTKMDIIHHARCSENKIVVTYEAADSIYHRVTDGGSIAYVRKKYDLPNDFVLYTGSLSPRKNAKRLLEAFARLQRQIPHKLVLTGSKSWNDRSVYEAISRLGIESRIQQLGYVEEEDMPALYSLAGVYVYPSLYEGFGLPVLEAMQCGCPVVASSATSIPEVAGDAAILVDPYDVGALADGIRRALADTTVREKLIAAGFRQAATFSWRRCANTMLRTIRETAAHS